MSGLPISDPTPSEVAVGPIRGLRQTIFVRMALLGAVVMLLMSWVLIQLGLKPLNDRATEAAFSNAVGHVIAELDTLRTTTTRSLTSARIFWRHMHPTLDQIDEFNEFFRPMLEADPFATSVVAGDADGRGWLLLQLERGRWRNRLTDVPTWGRMQHMIDFGDDGEATTTNVEQDYDPRQRPWYQVAQALPTLQAIGWTGPYRFFSTGDLGISAVTRIQDREGGTPGALALDLKLGDLSHVTRAATLGQRGLALIITEDLRVLALPRLADDAAQADWMKLLLQPVETLGVVSVSEGVRHWVDSGRQAGGLLKVAVRDETWLLQAVPFELGSQRLWVVATAPEADFAPDWLRYGAGLGLLMLALLVAAAWLARDQARRVVKPLEALADESERLGAAQFDIVTEVPLTNIREIRQLALAHEHARQLLKAHKEELVGKIAALEAAQTQIHSLAFYDPLTHLPNRRLFVDRLGQALARMERGGEFGALLFIDLDNFKTLNDTLGHAAGDWLLQLVAKRLTGCVRQSDTVSRFGGDEFLVMVEALAISGPDQIEVARKEARLVAQKILAELGQPALMRGAEYVCTPSIGVVVFQGKEDPETLLKWADMAMYQAKGGGRNTVRFFDPDFQSQAENRVAIEGELRKALRGGHFEMWLQPQFNGQREVVGAEALLRWPHLERGWISPAEFIPVAESSGLIVPLGQWILEQACQRLAAWGERPTTAHWTMSVNVSARQFRHPDFVAHTLATIERTRAPANLLRLELTESMLFDDIQQTIERMSALRSHGVGFSLDDFGTGYSSLSYLKQLPFAELKIDKSFVRDVVTDGSDLVLIRTMINLAHSLGLTVLAEGVETQEQFDTLLQEQCNLFQGYLLGRPCNVGEFEGRWPDRLTVR